MSTTRSFFRPMSGQQDVRPMIPMPMVYENVPIDPTRWEYRVLNVDTREAEVPDAAMLNDLGAEGWLLTGVLDLPTTRGNTIVHYYFVRQKNWEKEK
jgi:hypothetical protein